MAVAVGGMAVTENHRFITPGSILLYMAFANIMMVELWASTVYVLRKGRILEDSTENLMNQDPVFKTLKKWGERQLIPQWEKPNGDKDADRICGNEGTVTNEKTGHRLICGSLLDMKTRIYTLKVVVIDGAFPDLMVLLAVILLKSPNALDVEKDEEEEEARKMADAQPKKRHVALSNNSSKHEARDTEEVEVDFQIFTKVVIANVPTYVVSKLEHVGTTLFVGGDLPTIVIEGRG